VLIVIPFSTIELPLLRVYLAFDSIYALFIVRKSVETQATDQAGWVPPVPLDAVPPHRPLAPSKAALVGRDEGAVVGKSVRQRLDWQQKANKWTKK
jgi:hypothetical protein